MPTEQEVATVALDLINTALPAIAEAYEPDEVPAERPDEFVVLTVVRRAGGTARAGRYDTAGWSLYLMAASRTSVSNARNSLRLAGAALESRVLTVAGAQTTPVRFDNARPVGPDDGWFSGVNVYSFAL